MDFSRIMKFRWTWRAYQARVLQNAQNYLRDGKVHIVAAPGSGKTTLGIELIGRMGQPALVLAPSITIREQWVARIADGFLLDGLNPQDYISQSLKDPRVITVVTYQALHSAMNRYKGKEEELVEEEGEGTTQTEEVDYSEFDVVLTMKENKIGVLCLDECHHLRSEWWKALEDFRSALGSPKMIALTATPPYDSTPAMWKRYMDMCGEIDEEISIPELVKEGSLCPHQDFVYFNYPTEEENKQVEEFHTRSQALQQKLMQDAILQSVLTTHRALTGLATDEELLDNPSNLSALLIYMQAKRLPFPKRLQSLLGTKQLPPMDASWMEVLLTGFLYEDTESYNCTKEYREEIIQELKTAGVIEKKKISLSVNPNLQKLMTTSKGKCESVKEIVSYEYASFGKELRQLVLTDYIRKEHEKSLGNPEQDVTALGVLPFFEQIRRDQATKSDLRLGVLCGTIVIIPAEAKDALITAIGDTGKVTFSPVGNLSEDDYVKVNAVGDNHFLTAAVTQVFTQGYFQVMVGTKSLLGEGWDAPCINSLILASFVGSFMLSNQMRGRAIRVFKDNPNKTSNIWHLVCLVEEGSDDFALLSRRMEHFLGLHYTENIIENGMGRMSIIKPPFTKENAMHMNQQMLALAAQRDSLRQRWHSALSVYTKPEIVEQTEVEQKNIPTFAFNNSIKKFGMAAAALAVCGLGAIFAPVAILSGVAKLGVIASGIATAVTIPSLTRYATAEKRLNAFGKGIHLALKRKGLLEGKSQVKVQQNQIFLSGGSERDKTMFTQCVKETFAGIENQRYLLVKAGGLRNENSFYCVPEVFAKRKEDAQLFYEAMRKTIGEYDLVYTRNEDGRKMLLEGRVKSLGNTEKAKTKKRLSALE